jgi:hypothetical protein
MKEIANNQVCVLLRSGLELWIDAARRDELEVVLGDSSKRFIHINGQLVNPFEVLGVFTPDAMEDRQRRKNGQWKCMKGNWHEKGVGCGCPTYTEEVTAYVEGVGEVKYKR